MVSQSHLLAVSPNSLVALQGSCPSQSLVMQNGTRGHGRAERRVLRCLDDLSFQLELAEEQQQWAHPENH